MISIVIPVFNQLHYTRQCLDYLRKTVSRDVTVIIVDNGSTDGTAEFLKNISDVRVIRNEKNLGCAAAWNQGTRVANAEWTILLNNDVLLAPCWLEGLIGFAERNGVDIVSPAIREGEFNYDLNHYASGFLKCMTHASRFGFANGICFAVRRRVFDAIGLFDENFVIAQFEEADFFMRAKNAGFVLATTGQSFIHHFGSITQKAIGVHEPRPYEAENRAYFRRKWNLHLPRRLALRVRTKLAQYLACAQERTRYGHSLNEKVIAGKLRYF